MTRELTTHKVNPANDVVEIKVMDEPGAGGAHHHYRVLIPVGRPDEDKRLVVHEVMFQDGPIAEAGVNGLTQEVLLAIVEDRLASFQAGPYACPENEVALTCVRTAMNALLDRTRKRMARGVEGTHTV